MSACTDTAVIFPFDTSVFRAGDAFNFQGFGHIKVEQGAERFLSRSIVRVVRLNAGTRSHTKQVFLLPAGKEAGGLIIYIPDAIQWHVCSEG